MSRIVREGYIVSQYIRESGVPVLALERRCSVKHLVDQDTKGPPVDGTRVTAALDDLGCNVLFRPNERICAEVRDACFRIDRR